MADARALLREERARRDKDSAAKPSTKKRKADSLDSPKAANGCKKPRPEQQPTRGVVSDERLADASLHVRPTVPRDGLIPAEQIQMGDHALARGDNLDHLTPPGSPDHSLATQEAQDVDAEEMAAFEAELVAMDAQNRERNTDLAAAAQATISAKPMTAEEVMEEQQHQQGRQRGGREAEVEGEREDAARILEEEFEEMEGLEERVRVLRERREELRRGAGGVGVGRRDGRADGADGGALAEEEGEEEEGEDVDEDEDEEDEEDDFFARR